MQSEKKAMNFPMSLKNLQIKLVIWLCFAAISVTAQIPTGYYNSANAKSSAALKTALYNIIHNHTQLEYYHLSIDFQKTDWNPAGYFWDMYSNIHRSSWSGLNREHSLPKSWFGISSGSENTSPMGTDVHNLYPSDATANSAKSNYPLGEVTGTLSFTNGVVKVGSSSSYAGQSPSYSGEVFEPADEYKGDFARDYMYMVTCYETFTGWTSTGTQTMLLNGAYPAFRDKAIALLMKWHRNDPVSQKEIDRNNAVYKLQGNRNPFIDHPELAEFLWGKYVGQTWDMNGTLPEEDKSLRIHPNPAKSRMVASVNNPTGASYTIKSLGGVLLQTGKLASDTTLDVSTLKDGMYIIVIYTGSTRKTGKFAVRH